MAKLGFLGLGIMGSPMARHLIEAGHEVALWSKTPGKAEKLGGRPCVTPREVASLSEAVFLCVGDTAMSEEVVLGKDGLIEGAVAGSVIADCSTVSPSRSRAMGAKLAEKGVHFLDAPCTGSKPGAQGGTLTFMVGGDKEAFERIRPYLQAMGKNLYYCGGPGLGLHAKLSQNLILSNLLEAINEGLVLAAKAGVDPKLMFEILDNSAAKSGLLAFKAPFIFRRDFSTNFSTKWMHKDINLMLESGNELEVPLPLTAVTQQMFRAAIARGFGEDDMCGTIRVLEELTGQEVKG
jgi:3-hydroxyisobutyrate dehydrogenase-like beta-hydroxyacid dehydrogenase